MIQYAINYVNAKVKLLPCGGCSAHAVQYVESHPVIATSRTAFIQYVVDFHNAINIRLNKATMTVKEATDALLTRLDENFKDMPRALQIRMEDSQRIESLKKQLATFGVVDGAMVNDVQSERDTWMYTAIVFIILFVVVAILCGYFIYRAYFYKKTTTTVKK